MKIISLFAIAAMLAFPAFSQNIKQDNAKGIPQQTEVPKPLVSAVDTSKTEKTMLFDKTVIDGASANQIQTLYDLSGNVIHSCEPKAMDSITKKLPSGIYLLRSEGKTIKIIK